MIQGKEEKKIGKFTNIYSYVIRFLSDTTIGENRISPTIDTNDTSMLREQIQNIFSHHAQELDKCSSKYKTNLSNLKNRLHELENSTTATTLPVTIRLDS
jgi:hypothetical protein